MRPGNRVGFWLPLRVMFSSSSRKTGSGRAPRAYPFGRRIGFQANHAQIRTALSRGSQQAFHCCAGECVRVAAGGKEADSKQRGEKEKRWTDHDPIWRVRNG